MKSFLQTLIIITSFVLLDCSQKPEETQNIILQGKVIERESDTLILKKNTQDVRYHGITIPINEEGFFEYEMERISYVEEYELIFKDEIMKGAWRPISFYPDGDTIRFELYPMLENHKNQVIGGELIELKNIWERELNQTFEDQFNKAFINVDSLNRVGTKDELKLAQRKIDSLNNEVIRWQIQKFQEQPDLVNYSNYLNLLNQMKDFNAPLNDLKICLEKFMKAHPGHPYNEYANNLVNGISGITIGSSYVNFSAPDSLGNLIEVSSIVSSNKLTLIDLWAPWCGPCIKKSKNILAEYSNLKSEGFTVVGVIGGIKNDTQFFKAIARHSYPWLVLKEVQDQNQIWQKYNIPFSGGSQFLVDQSGKILAINPSVDEIKEFLEMASS